MPNKRPDTIAHKARMQDVFEKCREKATQSCAKKANEAANHLKWAFQAKCVDDRRAGLERVRCRSGRARPPHKSFACAPNCASMKLRKDGTQAMCSEGEAVQSVRLTRLPAPRDCMVRRVLSELA